MERINDEERDPLKALARTYSRYLEMMWRRRSLIALGVIAGLLSGALYYSRQTRLYESNAQVLIVNKRGDTGMGIGANVHIAHFEDYVSTHRILVRSPLIVERAIANHKLANLQCFQGVGENLTTAIIKQLTVQRVVKEVGTTKNSILSLTFRGTVPEECAVVVNAIVASYKDFLDETYRNMSDDTLKLVADARDSLIKELADKEEAYRKFRAEAPFLWKGKGNEDGNNPLYLRLARVEHEQSILKRRKADLEGRLATLEKGAQENQSREALVEVASQLASEPEMVDSGREKSTLGDAQLLHLLQEEQTLLGEYGRNHPHVLSVRKRIEATRNYISMPSDSYRSTKTVTKTSTPQQTEDFFEVYTRYLKQELDRISRNEASLLTVVEAKNKQARDLANYELQDEQFRSNIARIQGLCDGIIKRLQDVSLVKDYGGFEAKPIAIAAIGVKVSPRVLSVFPVAAFLGVMGGIGLAVLAEASDKTFRNPEELRRRLGLPVVGYIPFIKRDTGKEAGISAGARTLDPMLCTLFQPKDSGAEAYRGLRTALYFSSIGEGHKSIQITSSNMGEGKSTICANLAVSIAQSGNRVILVDADLRRPRQHKIFHVSATVGLSGIINGDVEIVDALQDTDVPNLSLLPCGPIPNNPAELLTSPRFQEMLLALQERCDYLLVDSAPLLAVSDPCAIAPRVDGVLMVVSLSKKSCENALRAKEILDSLETNVLGVIVNRTEESTSGSYAENYKSYEYNQYYPQRYGEETEPAVQPASS